jgi:SynChlorMet cassette radical SAM/SPASM protein ScmE
MITHATAPLAVRLELTRKCNLSCFHCLASASAVGAPNELSTAQWLAFFERLETLRVFTLTLTGGEIFARRDAITLLDRLAASRRWRLLIQTNGTLITPEIALRLRELRLSHVTVSLDGMHAVHDKIRGARAFERAIRGVRNLIAAGIVPSIAFTVMRVNLEELGPTIDFIASMGITAMRVNQLAAEGKCRPIYHELALRFPDDVRRLMEVLELKKRERPTVKVACSLGIHLNLPRTYAVSQVRDGNNGTITYVNGGCGACVTSCQVCATGDVVPCEGLSTFVAGNILKCDFLDIWRTSSALQQIRDLRKIPVSELPSCAACRFNRICNAGCRAQALNVYGDLFGPDPACPYCDSSATSRAQCTAAVPNSNQ